MTVRERGKLADAWAAEGQSLHMVVRLSDLISALGGPAKSRNRSFSFLRCTEAPASAAMRFLVAGNGQHWPAAIGVSV